MRALVFSLTDSCILRVLRYYSLMLVSKSGNVRAFEAC